MNRSPSVRITCDPCIASFGSPVRLNAEASDPDGDQLTFRWSATAGTLSADGTRQVEWTAAGNTRGVVSLTVTDGQGGQSTATLELAAASSPVPEEVVVTSGRITRPVGSKSRPATSARPPEPAPSPQPPGITTPELEPAAPAATVMLSSSVFQLALLSAGLVLVLVIVGAAFAVPQPTPFQQMVFRAALALGAACVATSIPGFVGSQAQGLSAGGLAGGLAVFALVYGFNPIALTLRDGKLAAGPSAAPPATSTPAPVVAPVTPAASRVPQSSIFISYRRSETTDVVGRLDERLREHFGEGTVFKDANTILPGRRFKDVIAKALDQCRVVIVVIGPQWETLLDAHKKRSEGDPGDLVLVEITTALLRQLPVIPTLVDRDELPDAKILPAEIASLLEYQALQLRPDPDFDHDAARLIHAIETLITGEGASA